MVPERIPCPSCGGAGGGPFGPSGSAWDDEEYVCPRCEGVGMILVGEGGSGVRPGLVKATGPNAAAADGETKRKATG
jgi:hypothetical protein